MGFTVNGEWMGVAYRDLSEGTYYPAVSLYNKPADAELPRVRVNFGPDFRFQFPADAAGVPPPAPGSDLVQLSQKVAAAKAAMKQQPEQQGGEGADGSAQALDPAGAPVPESTPPAADMVTAAEEPQPPQA